jgi:hydrogenase maturation factor
MSPEQQEWLYSELIKRLGSNELGRNVLTLANKSRLGLGDFDFGAIIGSIADAASKIGVSLIGAHAAQQANQTASDAAYNAQLAQLAAVKAQSVANSTTAMAISKYLLIGGVAIGGLAMVLMFMRKRK